MVDIPVVLLSLWDSTALNLIAINVDSMQKFPTRGEGPNQCSYCMINGPESTNSNVSQQSSIINGSKRRDQTKIDDPESNVINHLSLAQLIFNQTRCSKCKFSANTLNSLMVK